MSDAYLGEIRMFGGRFNPYQWALCNGDLLPISSNPALFSLIGTIYGGDGRTTFGLPDLRDRVPMHFGDGPGLTPRPIGERTGTEQVTLMGQQIPSHTHHVQVSTDTASEITFAQNVPAKQYIYEDFPDAPQTGDLYAPSVGQTGSNAPHSNMMPYLAVSFIICLNGIFPPRD